MKKIIVLSLSLLFAIASFSQEKPNIYNPEADAKKEIKDAISLAKSQNKHVFVQIGGNWCPWCIKFHGFVKEDPELKKLVDDNYVLVLVNYSQENLNLDVLKSLDYPQRFGFPVFIILDADGKRIHTQDTGLLEEGPSYDLKDVTKFFKAWSPGALAPEQYEKK